VRQAIRWLGGAPSVDGARDIPVQGEAKRNLGDAVVPECSAAIPAPAAINSAFGFVPFVPSCVKARRRPRIISYSGMTSANRYLDRYSQPSPFLHDLSRLILMLRKKIAFGLRKLVVAQTQSVQLRRPVAARSARRSMGPARRRFDAPFGPVERRQPMAGVGGQG